MEQNKLIITVGLPMSGKTKWAQKKARELGCPIVSPDAIRMVIHGQHFLAQAEGFVWATMKIMVKSLFMAGHTTVIIDSTHTTREERNQWISSEWKREFKVMSANVETCIARANKNNRREIVQRIKDLDRMYAPVDAEEKKL